MSAGMWSQRTLYWKEGKQEEEYFLLTLAVFRQLLLIRTLAALSLVRHWFCKQYCTQCSVVSLYLCPWSDDSRHTIRLISPQPAAASKQHPVGFCSPCGSAGGFVWNTESCWSTDTTFEHGADLLLLTGLHSKIFAKSAFVSQTQSLNLQSPLLGNSCMSHWEFWHIW